MNRAGIVIEFIKQYGFRAVAEIGGGDGDTTRQVVAQCDLDIYIVVERCMNEITENLYNVLVESDVKGDYGTSLKPVALMRMDSISAAKYIADGSLDLVFIDADHLYEGVKNDIIAWMPKVRTGGILCGHDYDPTGNFTGLIEAVHEMCGDVATINTGGEDNNHVWWVRVDSDLIARAQPMVTAATDTVIVPKPLVLETDRDSFEHERRGASSMITSFQTKKVAEYLKPGGKYLIRFGHGLGDTIMFVPLLDRLRELYPDCQLDLYVECGQEEIFDSVPDKDAPGYDEVFSLDFPMAEGSDLTKPAKCAIEELGIEPITGVAELPDKPSPLVCLHFQGTALPDSVGCSEEVAAQIWQEVTDFGKVCLEAHYEHIFHNPVNARFGFIDNSVRRYRANLHSLIGLIQHSWAFIGVASGPFVVALSVMPERTLYLEKHHKLECYTQQTSARVNTFNYEPGSVMRWLEQLEQRDIYQGDGSSSSSIKEDGK